MYKIEWVVKSQKGGYLIPPAMSTIAFFVKIAISSKKSCFKMLQRVQVSHIGAESFLSHFHTFIPVWFSQLF